MKKLMSILFVLFGTVALLSFNGVYWQNSDWKVPAEEANKKNPYPADKENLTIGKQLYAKHCQSCHGKEGLGDGSKAEELETFPGDFSIEEFQKQSDGALMYKLTEGREEMPGFKKKLPSDEDRWLVVSYMRTFE